MNERREFRRRKVSGNVEITSVLGAGTVPDERPTVVDCSLGGARLRVHSPARRLFRAVPPCLALRDSITCALRLAPDYDTIEVFAEVVRVARLEDAPDYLDVGVRFFHDAARRSHTERPMARLARRLEPDRSEEEAAALAKDLEARGTPTRGSGSEVATPGAATPEAAKPAPRTSGRLERPTSGRLERAASGRLERPTSGRLERAASGRQEAASRTSGRLERAASGRHEARTSGRLERAASGRHEARTSGRLERAASGRLPAVAPAEAVQTQLPAAPADASGLSDSAVVAWASARLAAPALPAARVTTADEEVALRGSARLDGGVAIVELPGAFTAEALDLGLTAQVTPTDDCRGLYVAERSPARLVVRELGGGRSDAGFDYVVVAARRVAPARVARGADRA